MKSRVVAAATGALALFSLAACGSDGGTGAPPVTTVKLGEASFVTLPPVLTSTTTSTVPGQAGGLVPGEQQYTVAAGDVLVNIAKKFCIKYTDIVSYNGWPNEKQPIYAGLVIKIPPNACAPGSTPEVTNAPTQNSEATSGNTSTTVDTAAGGTYTVKDGDTLSGIAAKVGTTMDAIIAANGWTDGVNHVIYKGLKIKLPAKTG